MAILNQILRAEGNKSYPANAIAFLDINSARRAREGHELVNNPLIAGGKQESLLGIGSLVQVNVETFDQNGGSQGIQGLDYTLDGTEPDFDPVRGGMELYHFMRNFCRAIQQGWDPTVSCWATKQTPECVRFNIQPKGDNGAPWPTTVDYNLVRIRDFIFTPVAPVVVPDPINDPAVVLVTPDPDPDPDPIV